MLEQGGNINVSEQLNNVLHNPIFDIKLMIAHMQNTLFNFNWITLLHAPTFFTDKAQMVMIPLFVFLLYIAITEDDENLKIKDKLISIAAFFLVYFMTSMVLYLSFTEVGKLSVSGYQTRYLFPVIPLILICISNNRVKTDKSENRNMNISIASSLFIAISIMQAIIV